MSLVRTGIPPNVGISSDPPGTTQPDQAYVNRTGESLPDDGVDPLTGMDPDRDQE